MLEYAKPCLASIKEAHNTTNDTEAIEHDENSEDI